MKLFGRERSAELEEPRTGMPIHSADGVTIGSVGEVRSGYFEVITSGAPGYWLSAIYIRRLRDDEAELSLSLRELEAHRLAEPGMASLPDTHDRVLSDAEALAQRERMERELREQRGTIDSALH